VVHINCSEKVKAPFSAYRKARQLFWANIRRKVVLPGLLISAGVGLAVLGVALVQRHRTKA
jgi:hypothetical protein